MSADTPLIETRQLARRYGAQTVFENVSLQVARGEFVAIVGESGVGKSTLLNCLAALDTWDAGQVLFDGTDLTPLDDTARALWRRAHVGFVFQAFHVLPHLTVAQNVALPLMLLGRRSSSAAASCSAWPSPVRWCIARRCCSRTSPPATSTPTPRPASSIC